MTHVGNAVALVVAETMAAAQDAAELVEITYEALPAATSLEDAIKNGAPQLWPEASGNVALDWAGLSSTRMAPEQKKSSGFLLRPKRWLACE